MKYARSREFIFVAFTTAACLFWLVLGSRVKFEMPFFVFETDEEWIYGAVFLISSWLCCLWLVVAVARSEGERIPSAAWFEFILFIVSWVVSLLCVYKVAELSPPKNISFLALGLGCGAVASVIVSGLITTIPMIKFKRVGPNEIRVPIAAKAMLIFCPALLAIILIPYSALTQFDLGYVALFLHPMLWTASFSLVSLIAGWDRYVLLRGIATAHERSTEVAQIMQDRKSTPLTREDFPVLSVPQRDILRETLKRGKSPDEVWEGGWSPLIMFCANGDTDTVKLLLDFGADVNQKTDMCRTSMYFAAKYGNEDIVKLLLINGADPNIGGVFADSFPIIEVAQSGRMDIAHLLLDAGVDVRQCNVKGKSLAEIASDNGHGELAAVFRKKNRSTGI